MKFAAILFALSTLVTAQTPSSPPEQAAQLVSQGIVATRVEDSRAALPYFQQAVSLDPNNADAWFELGMCQGRMGQQSAKATSLDKAVALRPTFTAARHQLVLALRLSGHANESHRQLAELRKYDAALASGVEKAIAPPTQVASR